MNNKDWIFKIHQMKKSYYPSKWLWQRKKRSSTSINFRNLEIKRNSLTVFYGKNGIGKTSLLNIFGLMDNNIFGDDGDVFFNMITQDGLNGYRYSELSNLKKEMIRNLYFGFMFQHDHLIDKLTGWENIAIPLLLKDTEKSLFAAIQDIKQLCNQIGFTDMIHEKNKKCLLDRSPSTYSGGQRQRSALLRAIIHDPEVIFADEPFASVDSDVIKQILITFYRKINEGKTIIMVVHDTYKHYFDDTKKFINIHNIQEFIK
ncbi:macrolide ABC transporter ATP-binding protein [Candidatus Magnetomorum sp. HK-1]|nr:macrolide ABC transporter ATP-binding protein [Candidatus Magnetomorum sp. HK-1]